jgi:uracil-DNA glycosylase
VSALGLRAFRDPAVLAARLALRDGAHVAPLRALADRIAREQGAQVPDPDPLDGGVGARLLILLETPGPSIGRTGFVSRDNDTGTAANLGRFLDEAGVARADTLIWNAVPFVIHAPGARNRAPRAGEIRAGAGYLDPLLALLPRLRAVVLSGRVAGLLAPQVAHLRPELALERVPHPSPTYVCTSPTVPARIRAGLHAAATHLA